MVSDKCSWLGSHTAKPCKNLPLTEWGLCDAHGREQKKKHLNGLKDKQKVLAVLLSAEGRKAVQILKAKRPTLAHLISTVGKMMKDCPERLLFCDTEFFVGTVEGRNKNFTCQIAISNARNEAVVAPATIKYPTTKNQLWTETRCSQFSWNMTTFLKFYGIADDSPVNGPADVHSASFEDISTSLDAYYKDHGLQANECHYLEWSTSGHLDYDNVRKGLCEAGSNDMLPEMPSMGMDRMNPLSWLRALRTTLELNSADESLPHWSLNLGNVYSTLFPNDRKTLKTQHRADTDVKMLIAVTQFCLDLFSSNVSSNRIEYYFPVLQKAADEVERDSGSGEDEGFDEDEDFDGDSSQSDFEFLDEEYDEGYDEEYEEGYYESLGEEYDEGINEECDKGINEEYDEGTDEESDEEPPSKRMRR